MAPGVLGAEHVDVGISDKPHFPPGCRSRTFRTQTQCMIDVIAMRLVAGAIAGAGEPLEVHVPAEMLGLFAKEASPLVADDTEIDPGFSELAQQFSSSGQRDQLLEMHPAEGVVEDPLGILPAI